MSLDKSLPYIQFLENFKEQYPDTILDSDVNEIRHLLYYLKGKNISFILEYNEINYDATIFDISLFENQVVLNVSNFQMEENRKAEIRFEKLNTLYQFDVNFLHREDDLIYIGIPSNMQMGQSRKSIRLLVDKLYMNFVILFRSLKGNIDLRMESNLQSEFYFLFREIKKDFPSLKLVTHMVVDHILKYSNDYEIIFFQNDEHVLLKTIFTKSEKSIFINDTSRVENYFEEIHDLQLTNYRKIFENLKLDQKSEKEIQKYFDELQKKEIRNFIISYVISPILLFGKCIGFIKVFTTAMDKYSITKQMAISIHNLTEIFSYALTKIKLLNKNDLKETPTTKIINLSLNGLQFEIQDKNVFEYLKKHNIIKMFIPLNGGKYSFRGEIVRYQEISGSNFLLGVRFFDAVYDDLLIYENYIHNLRIQLI